jgi:oligoribonuclease
MSIVWLDLETTGLSYHDDRILECGVIITDDKFTELARHHRIVNTAQMLDFSKVNPYVINMHAKTNLWGESIASQIGIKTLDAELEDLVVHYCYGGSVPEDATARRELSPILGGNTVDFDREFANVHLPAFAKLLHYRSLNVSSLNELAKRFWPSMYKERPNNPEPVHRVMADIEESIRVATFYKDRWCDGNVTGWN